MDLEHAWAVALVDTLRGMGTAVHRLFRARGFDFGGWPRPRGRAAEWDEVALLRKPLPHFPSPCQAI